MGFTDLILVGVGLSMDAFAASLCRGLGMRRINYRKTAVTALFFGGFQAIMPLVGWLIGSRFSGYIQMYDHWIAFVLLGLIGIKMIHDAFTDEESSHEPGIASLLSSAFATSIDALAVGVAFSMSDIKIIPAVGTIGVITYILCFAGVIAGNNFGIKYKSRAETCGGLVLIFIGLKILLEGLGLAI